MPHELIASYFTNRTQYVEYGNCRSSRLQQNIGVIQGSKCGPLFYDIYTGDLNKLCTENESQMYADDTCLCYVGDDISLLTKQVNERLKVIFDWCTFNKLSLNASKCKYMLFTNKTIETDPVILLNQLPIERVTEYKYLGVYMDDKLKYERHIDYLCGKISKLCGMSLRLKGHLDLKAARNVYYSCVYSSLMYCIGVFGGVLQCTQRGNRLKSLQDRVVKNLFSAFIGPNLDIYKTMKILKISDCHKLAIGIYMYKVVRLNECPTLQSNLDLSYPSHHYGTRNRNNLILPFPRVESLRINFKYQCSSIWNLIPDYIKQSISLSRFKKALIQYYISEY